MTASDDAVQKEEIAMIYDVHSHAWTYPDHFNDTFRIQAMRMRGYELDWTPDYANYLCCSSDRRPACKDRSIRW